MNKYSIYSLDFRSFHLKKIKITVFFVFLLGFLQRVGFPQLEGGSWRYEQQSRGKRSHQWATYDASGVRTLPLDIPGKKFIPWFGLNRSSTSLSKKYRFIPDGFPLVRFYQILGLSIEKILTLFFRRYLSSFFCLVLFLCCIKSWQFLSFF